MASNGALYGIIGALGAVVVAGGLYIAKQNGAFDSSTISTMTAPATVPVPPPAPAPAPAPQTTAPKPAPVPPPPPTAQLNQLQLLVADARRAITRGDFAAADRALVQAERIDPRSAEVSAARRDLRDAERQANRGDRRIDGLVAEARAAIARHDYVAADRLLGQAEQIDARDRDVLQARSELNTARQAGRDNSRVDTLVAEARGAIARHDFAAADRLLVQAEQIDARDRAIQQARAELANARLQGDRENQRVDTLVAQARAAIARHDYAAADRLLDQAENIDARDRDVQQARAELNAVQRPRR